MIPAVTGKLFVAGVTSSCSEFLRARDQRLHSRAVTVGDVRADELERVKLKVFASRRSECATPPASTCRLSITSAALACLSLGCPVARLGRTVQIVAEKRSVHARGAEVERGRLDHGLRGVLVENSVSLPRPRHQSQMMNTIVIPENRYTGHGPIRSSSDAVEGLALRKP